MNHHRVDCYISEFRDTKGQLVTERCKFTQAQANEFGAVLETDGIALDAAIRITDKWNAERKLAGTEGRYSIPFVKQPRD